MTEPRDLAGDGTRSLRRGVQVLRVLSTHTATGWRLSDLAVETGLDAATVHRLLQGLVGERLAARVAGSRRYTLGPLAYELGLAAAPSYGLDRLAAPILQQLATQTRDIVFLNVRSGDDSVCIARHEGRAALKAYTVDVGTRRPLVLSAGGVAILVALPRAEQQAVLAANLGTPILADEHRRRAARRIVARSRRAGHGWNQADFIPGIAAIGVAVRNGDGAPIASLSLAALERDLDDARRERLLGKLRDEAARVEALLPRLRYS